MERSVKLYGIPNCDSVKKAKDWLQEHDIAIDFHDYKTSGISKAKLNEWCKKADWTILLNKKSTTWRGLDLETQAAVTNQKAAVSLMQEHTSLIKRPVIELSNGELLIGFDAAIYEQQFSII